ncbi:MAG: peptidase M20 [Planctomycetota bacterium]|nr:MAG: peptidase M20 [Planctomycetota bacterium]
MFRTCSIVLTLLLGSACATPHVNEPAAGSSVIPPLRAVDPFAVAADAPDGFDREAVAARTRARLEALVAINTTNGADPRPEPERPDGNELAMARWFEQQLAGMPGVETHVLDVGNGRGNFVARLRANAPSERPVLILGHMDVVGADPARWESDPFVPAERDGYLYGRGVIDCKGPLAVELAAFEYLAARRDSLRRDIILLATAAEEGGDSVGVAWMLEHHAALFDDAEFALNEGGRVRLSDGRVRSVNIQTTEKVYYEVQLVAEGTSGHGSVPQVDNALAKLARATARVHDWRAPAQLNDTTREYYRRQQALELDERRRSAMLTLVDPATQPDAFHKAADLLAEDPLDNAVLRSAAALTMLQGGFRANVIPGEGRATFNLRILPGADVDALVAAMQIAAGPDVSVTLSSEPQASPPPSPVDTALFQAMEQAAEEMAPGVAVLPFMSTGATDGAALREAGIPTYGLLPIPLRDEDELRMHGDNERVPLAGLAWGAEYVTRVLLGVAGPR